MNNFLSPIELKSRKNCEKIFDTCSPVMRKIIYVSLRGCNVVPIMKNSPMYGYLYAHPFEVVALAKDGYKFSSIVNGKVVNHLTFCADRIEIRWE